MERETAAGALSLILLAGFVLVLIVLSATFVIVRTIRRYRRAAHRERPPPTEADDVWAMHKLPEDAYDYLTDPHEHED